MRTATAFAFLLTALIFAVVAEAGCRWDWDCTGMPCRQIRVCDSTIDVPAIRPPEVPPIAAPSIAPIPSPGIPPDWVRLGARSDDYERSP